MANPREHWTGRVGFIFATIASAVGLGSIWKFPYEVGANGGGVFLLFYVIVIAVVIAPLMLAEMAIGRRGRRDAVESMAVVAGEAGASRHWSVVGGLGVLISCLVLSYYSVVGGWAIAYALDPSVGVNGDLASTKRHFDILLAQPVRCALLHGIFMLITAGIVARGVSAGIEKAARLLMPVMVVLMASLAAYSLLSVDARPGLRFLFMPDVSKLSPQVALAATGLAFFSIGVGFASLMTYSAYADRKIDLIQVAIVTLIADTGISVLAGVAVFPLVFAHGLDPASGPSLVFVILPLAFSGIPYGSIAGMAFYVCVTVAALASAISMLEMPVSYLLRAFGWSRVRATSVSALACWIAGLATVMSFGPWSAWRPLAGIPGLGGGSLFDLIDGLASRVLLTLSGLGLAWFVGWIVPTTIIAEELGLRRRHAVWLSMALRYLVPICILAAALAFILDVA